MTLIKTYKSLLGRDPSEEEMDNLRRIAKAGGFKENDAIWTLFVAMEHYQTLYKEAPARIKDAVEGAIASVKEGSDAHAKEAMAKAHTALAEAVSKAAKEVASKSAGRDYAKWLTAAISAAVVALSLVGAGAYYLGHHIATSAAQDRGELAETAEGRAAHRLSKVSSIQRLSRCEDSNWRIIDQTGGKACVPEDGTGWFIP
jgi:hypothetical protein